MSKQLVSSTELLAIPIDPRTLETTIEGVTDEQVIYSIHDRYLYDGIFVSAYDADSITVDVDLGFGVWIKNQKFRLWGIDAPEIRGAERPAGLLAKEYLLSHLTPGQRIRFRTIKDKKGKYGRWLAQILLVNGKTLNDLMIQEGFADPY